MVGEVMLFMLIPIAGLCCGCESGGLPIPGLEGAMAGNDEFRELNVLLDVIVPPVF
jgi:hypothetical protein